MTSPQLKHVASTSWEQGNLRYWDLLLEHLRLRLAQRVLWVRHRHADIGDAGSDPGVIRDAAVDVLLEPTVHSDCWEFYGADEHCAAIGESMATLRQEALAESSRLAREHSPPAMELLVAQFNLSPLERDILLVAAAPEVDPAFGRLFGYVLDDASVLRATARLVEDLLCANEEDRCAAHRALLPESPLTRYALVYAQADPYPSLRVDPRVLDYLRGLNRLDEPVAAVLTSLGYLPSIPRHRAMAEQLFEWLQSGSRKRWTPVNLVGASPSANLSMAVSFARRAGLRLHRLDIARLPSVPSERTAFMRLLAREAVLAQLLLYIEVPEPDGHDAPAQAAALYWIEHLPLFFAVASRAALSTDRTLIALHLPPIEIDDRDGLWREALTASGVPIPDPLDAVVEQFDFGPQQALLAAQSVRLRARPDSPPSIDDLWEACREQSQGQLAGMARQIRTVFQWDDIVLPAEVFAQLHEIAAQVSGRSHVYQQWGFGRKLVRGRGISALFSGASGTGKTMAAEILANELHLDLYRVELPSMVSKYIGETEKNLRRLFDAADRSGVILFFDEADALFGRRTEVKDSHDRFSNIEINYLLQRMEEYNGLSILCTNRKNDVDRAFLRRLRFLVDFPFPGAEQRLTIWRKSFPKETPLGEIDYEALSRLEVAGGNIRNIALSAAFLAAAESGPVTMRHLLHASRREYGKMDKMIAEADFTGTGQEARRYEPGAR